jgi:hypothetical protein
MHKKIVISLFILLLAVAVLWHPSYSGSPIEDNKPSTTQSGLEESSDAVIIAQAEGEQDQPQSSEGGPQIFYPETEFDFGNISQGAKVSHKFVVKNVGDAPLKLIKAKGS